MTQDKSIWKRTGQDWTLTASSRPPENVQLETISEGGVNQTLIYSRNLWWYPDMKMCVYYTPKFWRRISERAWENG